METFKIGFGTWQIPPKEAPSIIKQALSIGFRHFDLAYLYGNQKQVCAGINAFLNSQNEVKREDLFIASKLWSSQQKDVENACMSALIETGLSYFDLYIVHWPIFYRPLPGFANEWGDGLSEQELAPLLYPTYEHNANGELVSLNALELGEFDEPHLRTLWQQMERLVERGLVKHIGVSNFSVPVLETLLGFCKVKPFCNQVECYPQFPAHAMRAFLQSHAIRLVAYCPLRSAPDLAKSPLVAALAEKTGKSPFQLCLDWNIKKGNWVIPRSDKYEFMQANINPLVEVTNLDEEGKRLYEEVIQLFDEQKYTKLRHGRAKIVDGDFVYLEDSSFV